ncbi:MAG: hypothetical protein KC656_04700, partial [Myxococcales bacterium]|nr:hypothetical protein [Myxococcales bacterium]
MSDTAALFAHLVRDLCGLWLDAHTLPLDERITATYRGLGLVVASAAALPVLPGRAPGLASPMLVDWPGLGAYEAYWRETDDGPVPMQASQTVEVVFQQLWAGLEQHDAGDVEKAVGTWGAGFEALWGPAALELLGVLQPAVLGYRADVRASFRPARREASPLV